MRDSSRRSDTRFARVRRFVALEHSARADIVRAAIWLPVLHGALRLLGFNRTLRVFGLRTTVAGSDTPRDHEPVRIAAIVRAVTIASSRGWVEGNCLSRALVALRMLERSAIPAALHFGVIAGSALEAHAWITCRGAPIDTRDMSRPYAPLMAQPAGASRHGRADT